MMTGIFIVLLNMSVAAGIVAIAVLVLRFFLRKAPKIYSYVLWAAVFFRLLCPYSFENPVSLMPNDREFIQTTAVSMEEDPIVLDPQDAHGSYQENALVPATENMGQKVLNMGAVLWLLGIIVLAVKAVGSYICVKRQVFDATLVQNRIYETDTISTAFVLGFIHPKIYLPTAIKGKQLEFILKHELVHVRRRDYLVKGLAYFGVMLHWFNPLVWISYILLSKDMEMACDEAVIRSENGDIRQDYATSLVRLYTRNRGLLSPLAFGKGSARTMQVRIKNILDFQKTPAWVKVFCTLLVMAFTAGFTTNPPQKLSLQKLAGITQAEGQSVSATAWQNTGGKFTLVEKEYTIAQLEAKNIQGLVISGLSKEGEKMTGVLSENVIIESGGATLKIQYYERFPGQYRFDDTITDGGGTRGNILIGRTISSGADQQQPPIIVTVPDQWVMKTISVYTGSGNTTINNCNAMIVTAKSESGNIEINDSAVAYALTAKSSTGDIRITDISSAVSSDNAFEANLTTGSGELLFRPQEGTSNYHFIISAQPSAAVTVNGKSSGGGLLVFNENAPKTVHMNSGVGGAITIEDQ